MNELERMELKISKFLRLGVMISGFIIAIGWAMSFQANYDPFENLKIYHQISLIDSFQIQFMLENWGRLIVYFGLMILISLPVLRVFLSVVLFVKQKEKKMAFIGAIVLLGLILSFSLGGSGH
jgi:uncharacterized membrane protein